MKFALQLLLINLFVLACAPNNHERQGSVFCSISRTDTYNLGADPSADFNVVNIRRDSAFNEVTCPNVKSLPYQEFVSRVMRTGDELLIQNDQFNGFGFTLNLVVSGNDVGYTDDNFTVNNCTTKRSWVGSLDPATNTLSIDHQIVYRGNCRSKFINDWDRH